MNKRTVMTLVGLAALGGVAYWLYKRNKAASATSVVRDAAGNVVRVLPEPASTTNPTQYGRFFVGPMPVSQ